MSEWIGAGLRRQGERLMQTCTDRRGCEEGCRFTRQGLAPEPVRARRFTTLQNPVSPATRSRGRPAYYQQAGRALVVKSERQKVRKPLRGPCCSLLSGWQRLFAEAKSPGCDGRRAPGPEPPPVPDLFAGPRLLVTG